MKAVFAQYLSTVARGLSVVGATDTANQVNAYAEGLRSAAAAQKTFAEQTSGITAAHEQAIDVIDQNIVEMFAYELAAKKVAAANAVIKPQKAGGKTGPTDAEIKAMEKAFEASQKYIESLKQEIEQIGLNADELKLLTAEREAAKAPTRAQAKEIRDLAQAYVARSQANDAIAKAKEQTQNTWDQVRALQTELDTYGFLESEVTGFHLAKLKAQRSTLELSDQELAALDSQIAAMERLGVLQGKKEAKDSFAASQKKEAEEAARVWENFTENVQRNLGDGLYDVMRGNFDNIGDAFLSMLQWMIADAAAADIMNAIMPGSAKGGSASTFGAIAKGLLGMLGGGNSMAGYGGEYSNLDFDVGNVSAKGNLFSGGQLVPFAKGGTFTNGLVDSPTLFDTGLMGEAGPEAIMPLSRGPDGSLGVKASGGGGKQISVTYSPTIHIDSRTDRAEVHALVSKAVQQGNAKLVDDLQRAGAI
jgi:hypothetical protein